MSGPIIIEEDTADEIRELCGRIFTLEHRSGQATCIAGEYARLGDINGWQRSKNEVDAIEEECDELKIELSMYLIAEVESEG